jgi:hypothetical protein
MNKTTITYCFNDNYITEYTIDSDRNCIHVKYPNGYECWYDSNRNCIHYKNSTGYEEWKEYDLDGKQIYFKNSKGLELWYYVNGKRITEREFNINIMIV